jgi:aryl-alcohol dehydrogenase-like predicted oxidoreductase
MTHMKTLDGTAASNFAFGTMQFGGTADETASRAMLEASLDAGINHFDTAYIYTDGASETILGTLAAPVRAQVMIASKVAYDGNGDPAKLQADFEVSRKRLAMECVDILYLHRHVGADLPRAIEWLAQQQSTGKIRYIGLSNFAAWQVMDAVALAKSNGTRIDIIQPMYNLVKRQAEVELLPMCKDQNIVCAPYSPLGGGLLTGKYTNGGDGRLNTDDRYNARYSLVYMHETAQSLKDLGDELSVNPATLAVAWVARHTSGPVPLISARSQQQLKPSLDATTFQMDDALYARITALSPTPPPATDRWEERV